MSFFDSKNVKVYADGTLGAGGHATAVVDRHPELETLIGFDLDPAAHIIASERLHKAGATIILPDSKRINPLERASSTTVHIVHANYSQLRTVLGSLNVYGKVDAMLLDLGVSSMQIDQADRGFSFLRDGPLDMRMNPSTTSQSASDLVNSLSEQELGRIIREYGEDRYWKSIARRIVTRRSEEPIATTSQLVQIIGHPGGGGSKSSSRNGKGIHPATRTFQALRIAVNSELESLAAAIPDAIEALAPGGRLAVISFHSLEDRVVKWAFRRAAGMMVPSEQGGTDECQGEAVVSILTKRPVLPGDAEVELNSRSRSAKLRVIEKL